MKLTPKQRDALQHMADDDGRIFYMRGGWWTTTKHAATLKDRNTGPDWYVTKGTVQALEDRGLAVSIDEGPYYARTRMITEAGRTALQPATVESRAPRSRGPKPVFLSKGYERDRATGQVNGHIKFEVGDEEFTFTGPMNAVQMVAAERRAIVRAFAMAQSTLTLAERRPVTRQRCDKCGAVWTGPGVGVWPRNAEGLKLCPLCRSKAEESTGALAADVNKLLKK
jgi:hypothetical protein